MDGNGNAGDREGRNILEDARNALQTGDRAGDGGGRPTRRRTFDGLSELEAALPMKRGLSKHYDGRSKSLGNLNQMNIVETKELAKSDHAINKRRRLHIAHKFYHKRSAHNSGSDENHANRRHDDDEGETDENRNNNDDGEVN